MTQIVELKIESDIPIPAKNLGKKGFSAVLRKLKTGQSVVFPGPISTAHNTIRYLGGNRTTHVVRKVEGGYRIWRIK